MTDWEYIYDERIAILLAGEKREPTTDEHKQALKEADEYAKRISKNIGDSQNYGRA